MVSYFSKTFKYNFKTKGLHMKYNLENSLIAKRNDKDINLLLESTNNINNYMDS